MKITHPFISAKADGTDVTRVKPTNWNAQHSIESDGAAIWVGRDASGPGDMQEFAVDHAPTGDDFTMYTKAQVDAAIATAIGGVTFGDPGDLVASMRATKSGWLLLNGQTIGNVGSTAVFANASAQALFELLWGLNGNTWPVLPARGASAASDWAALATLALPDARGCTIGMLDLLAGVNGLILLLGTKVGEQNHSLTNAEMPPHIHPANSQTPAFSVAFGGAPVNAEGGNTGSAGGDPGAVPPFSVVKPHNTVQPTMGANIFVKL